MSQLLRDTYSFGELQILSESKSNGTMVVRGLFQEAEKQNGNKRVYPQPLLEREIKKLQVPLNERRLVGELDHPSNEIVHLANASHIITGLTMEGNKVIGEAEILNTPSGKVLQELLKAGVKIGISSRAVGGLTYNSDNDSYDVNENLRMITWDMVSEPSCQGAFPGLLGESQTISETTKQVSEDVDQLRSERMYIHALKKVLNKK
tara:strand:+ start:501 stop:1118 length:618 start_codon:yes stop_codon:yes gene_type:complete